MVFLEVVMNRWLLALATSVPLVVGCQCVRVPDVTYPCLTPADCLASERCVAGFCATEQGDGGDAGGTADAGAADAGSDAGALDAGTDAGAPDAGSDAGVDGGSKREDCTNQVDDDLDGDADCADTDCRQEICRPRVHPCDAVERCTGNACPPDVLEVSGTDCDDGTACTAGDQCQADGGCDGVRGLPVYRCTQPMEIEILGRGSCPASADLCEPVGGSTVVQTLIAREIPDAGALQLVISSPPAADGGCSESLADGGIVITASICGDWVAGLQPRVGMCATNALPFHVSPVRFPQAVPVHQFRMPAGVRPAHQFSTDPQGPPLSQPDPPAPLFYACPP